MRSSDAQANLNLALQYRTARSTCRSRRSAEVATERQDGARARPASTEADFSDGSGTTVGARDTSRDRCRTGAFSAETSRGQQSGVVQVRRYGMSTAASSSAL